MTSLTRSLAALLLFGCGQVDYGDPGITGVAVCECVEYAPGCGDRGPSECIALTDPAQLDDPLWSCVAAVTYSGPLSEGCSLRRPVAKSRGEAEPSPRVVSMVPGFMVTQ